MNKNNSIQISLDLPFHFNITLETPLFYLYERHKFGILSQLAVQKGRYEGLATVIDGAKHKITLSDENKFHANLSLRNGVYSIKGLAEYAYVDHSEKDKTDLRINGVGKNGERLRQAQIGSVYSLLAHWSLSSSVSSIILPTGTGKTETMLLASIASEAKRTLVIVPGIDLKNQTADKYFVWGILRKLGIITYATPNPKVLVLGKILTDPFFIDVISAAEVVITTPAFIARAAPNSTVIKGYV